MHSTTSIVPYTSITPRRHDVILIVGHNSYERQTPIHWLSRWIAITFFVLHKSTKKYEPLFSFSLLTRELTSEWFVFTFMNYCESSHRGRVGAFFLLAARTDYGVRFQFLFKLHISDEWQRWQWSQRHRKGNFHNNINYELVNAKQVS